MHKCKNGRRDAHSSFKKHSIHAAVALAFGPALSLQAGAQSYLNYDGSRSGDLGAAAATWANAAEFKSDWGLGALNAQFAYALGFSGAGVKTGAVDSGYLPTHQEFASRGITGVVVSGTYANDGRQLESGGDTWKAGDPFLRNPVPGSYIPGVNDNHGNHVSGTIAAAKNGLGMMGVVTNGLLPRASKTIRLDRESGSLSANQQCSPRFAVCRPAVVCPSHQGDCATAARPRA